MCSLKQTHIFTSNFYNFQRIKLTFIELINYPEAALFVLFKYLMANRADSRGSSSISIIFQSNKEEIQIKQ